MSWRLLPYLTALLVGVLTGTIANSPLVAALAALVFSATWALFDHRCDNSP
jgi:hypothetical protein